MQLVFVYKTQAKSDAWSGKIQFEGPRQVCPDSPLRFVLHLLWENEILLTRWKAAENSEIGAMSIFFYFTAPRLGNKDM